MDLVDFRIPERKPRQKPPRKSLVLPRRQNIVFIIRIIPANNNNDK